MQSPLLGPVHAGASRLIISTQPSPSTALVSLVQQVHIISTCQRQRTHVFQAEKCLRFYILCMTSRLFVYQTGANCQSVDTSRTYASLISVSGFWRVVASSTPQFMPCPYGSAACPPSFNGTKQRTKQVCICVSFLVVERMSIISF